MDLFEKYMDPFDPNRKAKFKAQFDCGELEVDPAARTSVPEREILDALKRHLQMDFGERSAEEDFENFCAITFWRGCARSKYISKNGIGFSIETDFDQNQTRVALLDERLL